MNNNDTLSCIKNIKNVLPNGVVVDENLIADLLRNCVCYAVTYNHSKTNWIARELFKDIIPDDVIGKIFDEE